jgi:hypothetical protein
MSGKNPKRVAAGKRNRKKRGPLTEEGLSRLREAALENRPWEHSTGPKTVAGKAKAAANGRARQSGPKSRRQIRKEVMTEVEQLTELSRIRGDLERSIAGSKVG